jgi:hypothetical protein
MLTNVVQRWRGRRSLYRPAGEVIDTSQYEVSEIADNTTAKAFVLAHHYSGSYPSARVRFGLYRGAELVGVAVFGVPMNYKVFDVFACDREQCVELSRLVLLDAVPANAESWFLARCFEQLRQAHDILGVVSFSDPVPRYQVRLEARGGRLGGAERLVFPGHVGTIYQACNFRYTGRGTKRTLRVLPDGSILCPRSMQKIRAFESRWESAAAVLERFGATHLAANDDSHAWLETWVPRLTRPLKHGGNHRYYLALEKGLRRALDARLTSETSAIRLAPYPKLTLAVRAPAGERARWRTIAALVTRTAA